MRKLNALTLAAALAPALALALPGKALACGGFFRAETPVDQAAERVILKQRSADTVEVWLDVHYSGDPKSFAWVLPVPGDPSEKVTVPSMVFELLDRATSPILSAPPSCQEANAAGSFGEDAGTDELGPIAGDPAPPRSDVTVIRNEVVGDYEITTLSAVTAEALVTWLRDNGFRVTDRMTPFIDLYLKQNLNFLAIKLVPGAGASGIKPLKMVLTTTTPTVSMRLASLAAEPEMGLKVFMIGKDRYTVGNTAELEVPDESLSWDFDNARGNWEAAVARTIDANGGEGMVVDYAGTTEDVGFEAQRTEAFRIEGEDEESAHALFAGLLSGDNRLTRFYARYSPEEMGVDLAFKAAPSKRDVGRERQVPPANGAECQDASTPSSPCDFQACGAGGLCVLTQDGDPACACVDGAAARAVSDGAVPGGRRVSCVDTRMDVDPAPNPEEPAEPAEPGDPSKPTPALPDACASNPCGDNGECFALNGQQTCLCQRGFVAVARDKQGGGLEATCRTPAEDVPDDFYRRQLPTPRLPFPGLGASSGKSLEDDGCAQVGAPAGGRGLGWLWALTAVPLLWRRRRAA